MFSVLLVIWTIARVRLEKDLTGRDLQPNKLAKLVYVLFYILLFSIFCVVFYKGGVALDSVQNLVKSYLKIEPEAFDSLAKLGAPFIAFSLIAIMFSFKIFRDIDKAWLIWLHSISYLEEDTQVLENYLVEDDFNISEEENAANRKYVEEKFLLFIVDDQSQEPNIQSIDDWRKVQSLLRQTRIWNPKKKTVLTEEEEVELSDIEEANERRTGVAIAILRLAHAKLKESGSEPNAVQKIVDIIRQYSTTLPQGAEELTKIEAKINEKFGESISTDEPTPIIISSKELNFLNKKINYFLGVEFKLLLRRSAKLAARSIMYAGDKSVERLQKIKETGYVSLGKIERITIDRLLQFFIICSLGFPVLFSFILVSPQKNPYLIGFSVGCSVLCGAVIGSNRGLVKKPSTPWTWYIMAGLASCLIFTFVETGYYAIFEQGAKRLFPIINPYMAFHFFLAFGICKLARVKKWSKYQFLKGNLGQRTCDGIGLVMFQVIALSVLYSSVVFFYPDKLDRIFTMPFIIFVVLIYFLIGFIVVKDVRRVAYSKI